MPIITLLTDFGLADHFVGVMKGVILGICPTAQIVDITHQVTPFSIVEGGFLLAQSWRYFPAGTVHLAVVDPGVGSSRRAIVAEADGHLFVAPDNGLLSLIFAEAGATQVWELTGQEYMRHPVSRTFHGRDVFAPAAAYLAAGVAAHQFGPPLGDPLRLSLATPMETEPGIWMGTIAQVDRFGNLVTNFRVSEFEQLAPFTLMMGAIAVRRMALHYEAAGEGELFAIAGSSGYFEISIAQGHAAQVLGIGVGTEVQFRCEP